MDDINNNSSKANDVKTAVVILNWNGRQFLEIFLPMLIQRTPQGQLWVVDNGSTDDSMPYLAATFPEVKTLLLDRNYGFTGGYNRALSQIQAQYYVLLNSDVEVTDNWLAPLVQMMDSDPTIAAIQPKILSFAEKTRFEYAGAAGGFIDCMGYPFCRGRFIGVATEYDKGQYDKAREIFWATGAAFMVRAETYKALGGLDENFFAHMEEIDLCWRIKRAGYKIMVNPQSAVYHVGGGTLPVWSPMKTYYNFRNNIAMLYKNLSMPKFATVYFLRLGTDTLRFISYLLVAKWKFAAAIFRGHRDFWRMRSKLDRQNHLGHRAVGQIYRGSIIIRQAMGRKTFGQMMSLALLFVMLLSCGSSTPADHKTTDTPTKVATARIQPNVKSTYPHDPVAYTQGLLWHDGKLIESTGEYGHSTLRRVDPRSGKVEKEVKLGRRYFAEGLELIADTLYQLTWQEGRCFMYNVRTLAKIGEFSYTGEGWGLATDGTKLYMSDGSNRITQRDAKNFAVIGRLDVFDADGAVDMLNEMEWIDGRLWANIYMTHLIAVIDPISGRVEKYIDASVLFPRIGNMESADVLNGIAYDKHGDRIFVTGKKWDTLFEISITK